MLFPNQNVISQCIKMECQKFSGCNLQCFITAINTDINYVKCSKASNTLCIIHEHKVVTLVLFHSTFPPVLMPPVLAKLLLPQRWSTKTSAKKHMNVKNHLTQI